MDIILKSKEVKIDSLEDNEHCKDFLEELKKIDTENSEINVFCLSGNSYGTLFFKELNNYLVNVKAINKLILNDIFTSRKDDLLESLEYIGIGFANKNIKLLDVSNNAICPDGCEKLVPLLKNNTSIKYLYLNHIAMSQKGSEVIAEALLNYDFDLVTLEAIRNRIEVKGENFSKVITKMKNLKELVLYQNGMKEKEIELLLTAVINHENLQKFYINDNWIKGDNVKLLCKLIENTKSLVDLNISDCNIEEDYLDLIIDSINKSHKKWVKFTYNYNDITTIEALKKIIEALIACDNLKEIEVMGNFFEDDIPKEIFELCNKNEKELIYEESEEPEETKEIDELIEKISNIKL